MIRELQSNISKLVEECMNISWYSRGGIAYEEAYELTPFERGKFNDMIEKNSKNNSQSLNAVCKKQALS